MPLLDLLDGDTETKTTSYADVLSAMLLPLPKQRDKRFSLRGFYISCELYNDMTDDGYPSDGFISREQWTALQFAQPLDLLVSDPLKLYRNGFIAGHWLTYLIFASQRADVNASKRRWKEYAGTHLMAALQERQPNRNWVADPTSLTAAVSAFWPVAHFWAAATYSDEYRRKLIFGEDHEIQALGIGNERNGHASLDFLQRAAGFLQAGMDANAYGGPGIDLNDIWQLPDGIKALVPAVDHPDHMLEIDFERFHRYGINNFSARADRDARRTRIRSHLRDFGPPPPPVNWPPARHFARPLPFLQQRPAAVALPDEA